MKELLVIKVGTTSLIDEYGNPDNAAFMNVAEGVKQERERGNDALLVTSAAVSFGARELGIDRSSCKDDLDKLSALAALGQVSLMHHWQRHLEPYHASQNMITPYELDTKEGVAYIRKLEAALDMGMIPVVNENDAVADDEIKFGDNDRLMANIAVGLHHLGRWSIKAVVLSDVDGLYTKDPSNPTAEVVRNVTGGEQLEGLLFDSDKKHNSGGMATKKEAAQILGKAGLSMYLGSARAIDPISRLIRGGAGTRFSMAL